MGMCVNGSEAQQDMTRRGFVRATGMAACLAGVTGLMGGVALADEADSASADESDDLEGVVDALADRTTLHGLEGSMYDSERTIDDATVELLLQAGFSAPSAVGQTSLEFIVVTERDVMAPILTYNENANELNSCPLLIVLVEHDSETSRSRFYQYDSAMAAMAMMVQATSMGLSTCVMSLKTEDNNNDNAPIVYDNLGLSADDGYHPQLMVSFGYPAVDSTTSASVNNYDEARVHYETI